MFNSIPTNSFLGSLLSRSGNPIWNRKELPGGQLHQVTEGILAFRYRGVSPSSIILSAGIHGNETAPIEILNNLINDISKGKLSPQKNCLFILGNPEAIKQEKRFVEDNLNRLFQDSVSSSQNTGVSHSYERHRAEHIMAAVDDFLTDDNPVIHYDLHTAIRPSAYKKFAIYPYLPARTCSENQLALLGRGGVEALLLQSKPTTTFSGWTTSRFGAESFTLELGKVNKFGENDLTELSALDSEIRQLLTNTSTSPKKDPHPLLWPTQYLVFHEIINTGTGFKLNISDNTANFTQLNPGYEVWRDSTDSYVVEEEPVAIVFPNSKVEEGQRAGLLVKRGMPVLV